MRWCIISPLQTFSFKFLLVLSPFPHTESYNIWQNTSCHTTCGKKDVSFACSLILAWTRLFFKIGILFLKLWGSWYYYIFSIMTQISAYTPPFWVHEWGPHGTTVLHFSQFSYLAFIIFALHPYLHQYNQVKKNFIIDWVSIIWQNLY